MKWTSDGEALIYAAGALGPCERGSSDAAPYPIRRVAKPGGCSSKFSFTLSRSEVARAEEPKGSKPLWLVRASLCLGSELGNIIVLWKLTPMRCYVGKLPLGLLVPRLKLPLLSLNSRLV
jgi:hypothetical protein